MTAQLTPGTKDGIRPLQQSLIRLFVVLNNVQCIEIFWIEAVPAQDLVSEVTLKRGKAQPTLLITLEQKLDQRIAEPANTIVEKNGATIGHQDSAKVDLPLAVVR